MMPSSHSLLSKWASKNDKSKLVTFSMSGIYSTRHYSFNKLVLLGDFFGIFVGTALGGLIAAHWSWEWIFYLSGKFDRHLHKIISYYSVGASAIIWAILWFCFITESPLTHPTITPEELTDIKSNVHQSVRRVNI